MIATRIDGRIITMADHKLWCWEAAPHGPDWLFLAQVDPASEEALAQLAADAALPGYSAIEGEPAFCSQHQQMCPEQTFIDIASAPVYADTIRGDHPRNIWVYNTIRIHRGSIAVECGYGGRGEEYNDVETSFLLNVLAAPGITLQSWSVLAGGNGYDYTTLHEGEGIDELNAYLA
jgi:hypothetical protein